MVGSAHPSLDGGGFEHVIGYESWWFAVHGVDGVGDAAPVALAAAHEFTV